MCGRPTPAAASPRAQWQKVTREETWHEITDALRHYEDGTGFEGKCEPVVAVGTK